MKKLLMIVMALAAGMAARGDEAAFARSTGASMRLDTRTGTRIAAKGASETIAYSPKWGAATSCTVTADGATLKTASAEGDVAWSPTTIGAHTLTHTAGDVAYTAQFTVLGDDVAQHAGALTASETWASNTVHLVTADVTVPSGKTLTIAPGAVVKFMTGTSLTATGTCMANSVIFTHVNDDTAGGDTLMDGDATKPLVEAYRIEGNVNGDDTTEYRYVAPQELASTIASTTRLRGHAVYLANSSITVNSGVTLTLSPGAIIKFASGCSLTVKGALDAQGTRAAPIIFTSLRDDEWGGDTNGDGGRTLAQPGDWSKIKIEGGVATFNYARILYSSKEQTTGAINMSNGKVVFDNGVIAHGAWDAIGVEAGTCYVSNSVIADCLVAFRHWTRDPIVNCVIYDCGRLTQGGGQHFYNCVFSKIVETWEAFGFPQNGTTYRNCCFWNEGGSVLTGEGRQDAMTVCGKNGNIWADPKFIDPDNGDFRIAVDSPCVDAGDGTIAPKVDYHGQPRMNVKSGAQKGTPTAEGSYADIGIYEVMPRNMASDIDMRPVSVKAVGTATPGKPLRVEWVIQNSGRALVSGSWRDTISLVSSGGQEIPLGDWMTAGRIAVGDYLACSASFMVPALAEGTWQLKVNVNSYHDVFEGALFADNVKIGDDPVTVALPSIDPAQGATDGVINAGVPKVLKLTFAEDEENRMVHLDLPAGVKVAYGLGFMPRGANASGTITAGTNGVLFRVPEGVTDVYVTLESDTTAQYALSFESAKVEITSVSPNTLPSSGQVTVTITGAGFVSSNTVELVGGGKSVVPGPVQYVGAGTLVTTIDCAKLVAGTSYDLQVGDGETVALAANAVSVAAVQGKGQFWARLVVPDSVRQGRKVTCYVEYGNSGTADLISEVIQVGMEGDGSLQYVGDLQKRSQLQFMSVSEGAFAGVLPAHSSFRIPFSLRAGSRNVLSLYTSVDNAKFEVPWGSRDEYLKALSDAATRMALKQLDASRYESVFAYAKSKFGGESEVLVVGTVSYDDGTPVENVLVRAMDESGNVVATSRTNASGTYSLECLKKDCCSVVLGYGGNITNRVASADREGAVISLGNLTLDSDRLTILTSRDVDLEDAAILAASMIDESREKLPLVVSSDRIVYLDMGEESWRIDVEKEDCLASMVIGGESSRAPKEAPLVFSETEHVIVDRGTLSSDDLYCIYGETLLKYVDFDVDGRTVLELPRGKYTVARVTASGALETVDTLTVENSNGSPIVINAQTSRASRGDEDWDKLWWFQIKDEADELLKKAEWYLSHTKVVAPPNEFQCDENMSKYYDDRAAYEYFVHMVVDFKGVRNSDNYWNFLAYCSKTGGDVLSAVFYGIEKAYFEKWTHGILSNFLDRINDYVQDGDIVTATTGNPVVFVKELNAINLDDIHSLADAVAMAERLSVIVTQLSRFRDDVLLSGKPVPPEVSETIECASAMMKVVNVLLDLYKAKKSFPHYFNDVATIRQHAKEFEACLNWFEALRENFNRYHNCGDGTELYEPAVESFSPNVPQSCDPNEMVGPMGKGDPETQRFVKSGEWMTYTVYFENKSDATAAAQEVYVSNPLSEYLDWSTFEMGEVAFNNQIDLGLSGKKNGTSEVTMNGTNYAVRTELKLDEKTGVADWYMRIVDPTTETGWPEDVLAGFLPPNDETFCGEGHITYRVKVREDAPVDAVVENSASIVFDYNDPIETDPAWWNTVANLSEVCMTVDGVETNLTLIVGEPFGELPTPQAREGYEFGGWFTGPNGAGLKAEPAAIVPMGDFTLYPYWISLGGEARFVEGALSVDEGSNLVIRVNGGNMDLASSVQVQAMYNTAAAADLDLKGALVDGAAVKSFKFPVTLNWAAGEVGEKTIEIPVVVDKTVEADEMLTLQLVNPMNLTISGSDCEGAVVTQGSACTVTIRDPQFEDLKAKVVAGSATKAEADALAKADKVFVGKSYVRVLANDATRGKVTGSTLAVDGKNVTLKATANKGFVFAGWYTDAACSAGHELAGFGDYRNPSLAYVNTNGAVTVYARFITPEEDSLALGEDFLPGEFAPGADCRIAVPVESVSYPTVKVTGLPAGMKFADKGALVKATKTTDAYTVEANTIYGAPTKAAAKPTVVTVTVKNLGGYQIVRQYEVTVKEGMSPVETQARVVSEAAPYQSVAVDVADDFSGTILGAGVYQAGKKVTLKATANKGFVFSGWYEGEGLLTRVASFGFTMPSNDVSYVARFVTDEEDAASIATGLNGIALDPAATFATNVMAGVALQWPVAADALSQTTVTVSGLPAGLKFTAKDVVDSKTKQVTVPANTIYGAPTAASKVDKSGVAVPFAVNVTATTAGKAKRVYPLALTVDPLPVWTVGTFNGPALLENVPNGLTTLTIANTGKISGKLLTGGLTWSLAAGNFIDYSPTDGFLASLIGTSGKLAFTNELTVTTDALGGLAQSERFAAAQNNWKVEPWKSRAATFGKTAAVVMSVGGDQPGEISLKFATSGAVTAAGAFKTGVDAKGKDMVAKATCATAVCPDGAPDATGAFEASVFVYFPPKGAFAGYSACIRLRWDGTQFVVP